MNDTINYGVDLNYDVYPCFQGTQIYAPPAMSHKKFISFDDVIDWILFWGYSAVVFYLGFKFYGWMYGCYFTPNRG